MPGSSLKMPVLALLMAYTGCVSADSTFYIGGEGGYADIHHDDFDESASYSAYIGWQFEKAIALEASYGYLGEFDVSDGQSSIELDSVSQLAFVFSGPFIDGVSTEMTVKFGGYSLDVTPTIASGTSESFDDTGFTFAYGLAQPIGEHLAATFNWQYYRHVDDVSISTYSLGLRIKF